MNYFSRVVVLAAAWAHTSRAARTLRAATTVAAAPVEGPRIDLVEASRVTLAPTPGGGTELVLTHRGVPKHLLDQIEDYWRLGYWAPLKARID